MGLIMNNMIYFLGVVFLGVSTTIASWKAAEAKVLKCKSPPKPWYKPWQQPKETCKMSTLSDQKAKELAKPQKEEKKEESK